MGGRNGNVNPSRQIAVVGQAKLPGAVKNKTVPLLLICASGSRAQRAVATAKKLGYEQAQAVSGGLKAWKDANLPVEKA